MYGTNGGSPWVAHRLAKRVVMKNIFLGLDVIRSVRIHWPILFLVCSFLQYDATIPYTQRITLKQPMVSNGFHS